MRLPDVTSLDPTVTRERARARLDAAMAWAPEVVTDTVRVASGWLDGVPRRAWASRTAIAAPPADVARWMADAMIERLPDWSDEFVDGEVLDERPPGDATFRRVVRARYHTPWPLADREYVYWLERFDADGETLITYQSVVPHRPASPGAVYATLHATAHRVRPHEGGTQLDHVLVTDLGGRLPGWAVDHLFRGGLRAAHLRDARAQQQAFACG